MGPRLCLVKFDIFGWVDVFLPARILRPIHPAGGKVIHTVYE